MEDITHSNGKIDDECNIIMCVKKHIYSVNNFGTYAAECDNYK